MDGVKIKVLMLSCLLLMAVCSGRAQNYDPLAADIAALPPVLDLTVLDAARQRDIPIRIYLPTNSAPEPVVLFSHGLGGNREGSRFLGEHWAARGYVAVFPQHPGSDDSIWKGKSVKEMIDDPNHHRVILALSTAFWDACLRGDAAALAWLNSDRPRAIMEAEDRWQFSGQ